MAVGKDNVFLRELVFFTTIVFFISMSLSAYSLTLYGKKADKYLGNVRNKLLSRGYSAITLDRRSPSPDTSSLWDGIIFFPGRTSYSYIRRLNSDYVLRLGPWEKESAVEITGDNIEYYLKAVETHGFSPAIVLDKEGKEVIVVYRAFYPCHLRWNRRGETLLFRIRKDLYDRSGFFWPVRSVPLEYR